MKVSMSDMEFIDQSAQKIATVILSVDLLHLNSSKMESVANTAYHMAHILWKSRKNFINDNLQLRAPQGESQPEKVVKMEKPATLKVECKVEKVSDVIEEEAVEVTNADENEEVVKVTKSKLPSAEKKSNDKPKVHKLGSSMSNMPSVVEVEKRKRGRPRAVKVEQPSTII